MNIKEFLEWNWLKWKFRERGCAGKRLKARRWGVSPVELAADNAGMGTVEVILIIVVLVGLVIIFKTQITSIVGSLFQKISNQAGTV